LAALGYCQAADKSPKKQTKTTPSGPADAVHDVISMSFTSDDANNLLSAQSQMEPLLKQLDDIDNGRPFMWPESILAAAVAKQCKIHGHEDDCAVALDKTKIAKASIAYVFHIVTWSHAAPPAAKPGETRQTAPTYPVSSDWHVYQWSGNDTLISTGFSSDGNPRMYNKKQVLIVGVDRFSGSDMTGTIVDAYKSTATPGPPQNETNLATLLDALLGIPGAGQTKAAAGLPQPFPALKIFIASGVQPGTVRLPFDLKVTVTSDDHNAPPKKNLDQTLTRRRPANPATAGPGGTPPQDANDATADAGNGGDKSQTPKEPAPGVVSCTGTNNSLPCTTTRTFNSIDREWWDVSIGIAIPGVRETKYGISNGALDSSVTRHTDFYAMLDLYPFAFAGPKDDWEPHFNVGVPITGQSLYRPYFGMAESLGGLLTRLFRPKRQIGLPMGLNVFAGVTWMKTQVVNGDPTTASALATDTKSVRVRKALFGVEVPVSSIASKIKSVAGKNANGSGKGSTPSGGDGS
jgi:hypothetical protein